MLLVLATTMLSGLWVSRFDPDESQWIYTTRYLTLFRQADFRSPEWHTYWTQTQPPLARYVMGASLKIAGYDLLRLNGPWNFDTDETKNAAQGNLPSDEVLFRSRLPIAVAASISVLLMYLIGRHIASNVAGLGAAAWLALNPRTREIMTRAEADGLLICLLLLGLLLAMMLLDTLPVTAQSKAARRNSIILTVLLGLTLGLGASAKLTGAIALAAFAVVLSMDSVMRLLALRKRGGPDRRKTVIEFAGKALVTLFAASVIAVLTFLALNPALYSNPAGNTINIFQQRQIEMSQQMMKYPAAALPEGLPRLQTALQRVLFTYSVGHGLFEGSSDPAVSRNTEWLPLDAILVGVGLLAGIRALARRLSRWFQRASYSDVRADDGQTGLGAAGIALLYTPIFYFSIALNMGLDWDRYALPILVFAALWAGVGIGAIWRLLAQVVTAKRSVTIEGAA